MREIKQLFLIFIMIFALLSCFVGSTYSCPLESLKQEMLTQHKLQSVVELIDNQEYKKAFTNLEQIHNLDYCTISHNNSKFATLITKYKEILIEESNNYTQNGEYVFALNLLNSKLKYYQNDENILSLIEYNTNQMQKNNLVKYTGEITHFTTNCLLAFPNKALNTNNPMGAQFDNEYLTPNEFEKILFALYTKNYILINPETIIENIDSATTQPTLWLPKNKKPLILSFNNCSYSDERKNKGLIDKVILDRNGEFATFTSKQTIAERVSYDNDFIPILENFVKTYPDFSFNGAKGVICLNGNDGILGYNTQKSNATSRYEIKKALQVITRLKKSGWIFACSSYTNKQLDKLSDVEFAKAVSNWINNVEPIVGKTAIFVANCTFESLGNTSAELSYKQQLLLDYGFKMFCQTDNNCLISINDILIANQLQLCGQSLRSKTLDKYFGCEQIYDHINRIKPFAN